MEARVFLWFAAPGLAALLMGACVDLLYRVLRGSGGEHIGPHRFLPEQKPPDVRPQHRQQGHRREHGHGRGLHGPLNAPLNHGMIVCEVFSASTLLLLARRRLNAWGGGMGAPLPRRGLPAT